MEFLIAGDDVETTGGAEVVNNRNTFIGLASGLGRVGIGRNDSPYKKSTGKLELFSSVQGDYNQISFDDVRMEDTIFYYSPNWNGISFGAAIGLLSSDSGSGGNDSDGVEVVSVAATYKNGPFFASLAHESETEGAGGVGAEDYDKWRLGLGYTANGFHVGYIKMPMAPTVPTKRSGRYPVATPAMTSSRLRMAKLSWMLTT
jgi:predicted porin